MMSKSKLEQLAKIRAMGRRKFVLYYGVLGWGVSTAILFAGLEAHSKGFGYFLPSLAAALVLYPLAGIVWGRFMWWYFERMSNRAEKCS